MSILIRHRSWTISVFSPFSLNTSKKLFNSVRYCTLKRILPIIQPKQCHLHFLPMRRQGSTVALFVSKKDYCNISQSFTNLESSEIVKQLSRILQCSVNDACKICQNYHLQKLDINDLNICVEKLKQFGIVNDTIKQNIWVLFLNKHQLASRLELLVMWKFTNLNNAVSLLKLPFARLKKLTLQAKNDQYLLDGRNKITYFSSYVECHEKEGCELFVKYPFMMTLNLDALKAILTMIKDVGILTEHLLGDPWLFRYSSQFIANRIQLLDEIEAKEKCKVIKPWMLRCTQSALNRYFELKDENIAALGSYTNIKDLLSNELDLSDAEVEEMFLKHPPLAKISYSKAKEMIDFLKAEGFVTKMIYQVPRVLCHKQATLLGRILELKKVNPRMMSLQNLCRNKKDYLAFLSKMQGSYA